MPRDRYAAILPVHKGNTDAAISKLATLATFYRVPLQEIYPAAPSNILYVGPLPKKDRCSTLFHRSAAITLLQTHAVQPAPSALVLLAAVLMVESAAPALMVRILTYLPSSGSQPSCLGCCPGGTPEPIVIAWIVVDSLYNRFDLLRHLVLRSWI